MNSIMTCRSGLFTLISRWLRMAALLMLGAIMIAGCNVTKNFDSREYLLIKNKIRIHQNEISGDDLEAYLQQHPNKKLFGLFRTNIAVYNAASKGDDTKFKKWLRTKIGSAPVILDTSLVSVTAKQMQLYLANKGYFKSTINDTVIIKKKKATVIYDVKLAKPYLVRNIAYMIPDTQVARYIYHDSTKCLVRKGRNYDAYLIDNERTRITNYLLNNGFYRFNSSHVFFRIDTNLLNNRADVIIEITNPVIPSFDDFTTVQQVPHKRYFFNRIYIYPEYDHLKTITEPYDTLVQTFSSTVKSQPPVTYYFLYQRKFKIRPRTITQSIFITPGGHYNLMDVNQSYAQLSSLQVFNYINMEFREPPATESNPKRNKVDCHLELTRSQAQSFTTTLDGTNSAGAFGVQGSLGYQHRNIFGGAQLLRLNLTGSLQMQASDGGDGSFFNVIELGANAGITFPQFLLPIKPERFSKYFKPKTTVSVGYNFQHQQHYDRHISNISFGYSWQQNEKLKHVLNPVEISLVKVFPDAYFDSIINNEPDARLRNQYTDHLVAGLKYTLTFNNQQINKIKDFIYLRSNIETGGNLIYAVDEIFKVKKDPGSAYKLFGLPYSQYFRPDIDIRYYNLHRNNYSVVYRFYGGIGIPYGNSTLLPFEKAFFAGGANGMRGWKMYTLGPGTYHSDNTENTFNQIGDIQLEANIEYRFPMYDWIRGALFIDIGNIWLLQETADLPGGKFKFPGFMSELGIDAGFGIRLDFDFFIVRLDPAIPIRVPSYPKDDRWYFNKMQLGDIVWNFGIGYPF